MFHYFLIACISFALSCIPNLFFLQDTISLHQRIFWHISITGLGIYQFRFLRQGIMRITQSFIHQIYYGIGTPNITMSFFGLPFCNFVLFDLANREPIKSLVTASILFVIAYHLALMNILIIRLLYKSSLPIWISKDFPSPKTPNSTGYFCFPYQGKKLSGAFGRMVTLGYRRIDALKEFQIVRPPSEFGDRLKYGFGDWSDNGILEQIIKHLGDTRFSAYTAKWID